MKQQRRTSLQLNTVTTMDTPKPSTALFDVFLRLRPSAAIERERFLDVESAVYSAPTHITIKPPVGDTRKRAVERFAFTQVFEEAVGQKDIFQTSGTVDLIQGVLGKDGKEGRDGLLATLGVTGSGKVGYSYSQSQRGESYADNIQTSRTRSSAPNHSAA